MKIRKTKHNKKKAFTLIELLAIIVILAIIAVITVPIILNIIDNSKKGAVINSAYGFKDSIQKYYTTNLLNNTQNRLSSGYKDITTLPSDFEVSGNKPIEGWVKLNQGSVEDFSIRIGDYVVTKIGNQEIQVVKNGVIDDSNTEVLNNIESYFTNDIDRVVYYNPIDGVYCNKDTDTAENKYDSDNSTPGYKGVIPQDNALGQTKCLKWYKYSTNIDGTINLILDHNTETKVIYYTSEDNSHGPSNLLQYLTLSEWRGVPTRNDKYTAYADNGTTKTAIFTNLTDNSLKYLGKARLITAQEIAEITGASSPAPLGINWNEQAQGLYYYYFGSYSTTDYPRQNATQKAKQQSFYWLFENLYRCQNHGCSPTVDNAQPGNSIQTGNIGYWTSSPNTSYYKQAWGMYYDGSFCNSSVTNDVMGLRPVITISM